MTDEVRKESPEVARLSAEWPMLDALLGGTRAMRAAAESLLPKWPKEEKDSYAARLAVATLFPGFERTVEVMSAKPFSKPLTIKEASDRIQEWADDIDLQGRNLHAFAGGLCSEALSHGICGILVEYPRADGVRTQADEQAAGVRPYFVHIKHDQILGWRAKVVGGMWVLTQLRLIESVSEPSGEFSDKSIEQVRVLEPRRWRTFRKASQVNASGDTWQLHEEGTTTLGKVPFVPVYGKREGFMVGCPPLLNLAYLNVKHWQSQSDQDTILHVARVPLLAVIGVDDDKWTLSVGASSAIKLPINADAKYIEHSGAAISAGKESLDSLEDQMRQAGAELLVIKPGNTSVPQTLSDNEPGKCALQRITEDLEDALDQAMLLMAEWVGESQVASVELFKDFSASSLIDENDDLIKLQQAGVITKKRVILEKQRRGKLSPDIDPDDELEEVSEEGPALGKMGDEGGAGAV